MNNLKGNVCLLVFLKSKKEKTDWERRQKTRGGWRFVSRGQGPITHPHQHNPSPGHRHHCRWAHSGWHQPRRLHTPRPGRENKGQRAACEEAHSVQSKSKAERGCRLIPLGSDTVSRAWIRLNVIDGLCNCGGYPGPISFQVIRQREGTNSVG